MATGSRGHNGPKVLKEEGEEVGVSEHGFPRQAAICPSVQPPPRILQAILSSLLQPTIRRSLTLSAGAVECGGNQVQSHLSVTNSSSLSTCFICRYKIYSNIKIIMAPITENCRRPITVVRSSIETASNLLLKFSKMMGELHIYFR